MKLYVDDKVVAQGAFRTQSGHLCIMWRRTLHWL
jgi:hypothetical protein